MVKVRALFVEIAGHVSVKIQRSINDIQYTVCKQFAEEVQPSPSCKTSSLALPWLEHFTQENL